MMQALWQFPMAETAVAAGLLLATARVGTAMVTRLNTRPVLVTAWCLTAGLVALVVCARTIQSALSVG